MKEQPFYETALEKPLEEITEDIFLRAEAFEDAPWYGEFLFFTRIGMCQTKPEHIEAVRKALKMMGYPTHTVKHDEGIFILPGEVRVHHQDRKHEQAR